MGPPYGQCTSGLFLLLGCGQENINLSFATTENIKIFHAVPYRYVPLSLIALLLQSGVSDFCPLLRSILYFCYRFSF